MQSRCHNQTLAYVLIQMSPTSFVPLGSPLCTQILAAPDILRTYRSSWSALVLWAFKAAAVTASVSLVLLRLFVSCTIPGCDVLAAGNRALSNVPLVVVAAGGLGVGSGHTGPQVTVLAGKFPMRSGGNCPSIMSCAECWCGPTGRVVGLAGMSCHDGS